MKKFYFIAAVLILFISQDLKAQIKNDSLMIIEASLDYLEGWYNGDAERMDKALHQDLVKRRIDILKNGGQFITTLSKSIMMEYTRAGFGKRPQEEPKEAVKNEIIVLDIFEDIAIAKAISADFIDYLHLVKIDGQWKILNVLWDIKPGK